MGIMVYSLVMQDLYHQPFLAELVPRPDVRSALRGGACPEAAPRALESSSLGPRVFGALGFKVLGLWVLGVLELLGALGFIYAFGFWDLFD